MPPTSPGRKVGVDVAEHVLRQHDIERFGTLRQAERGRVHINPFSPDLGKLGHDFIEDPAKNTIEGSALALLI